MNSHMEIAEMTDDTIELSPQSITELRLCLKILDRKLENVLEASLISQINRFEARDSCLELVEVYTKERDRLINDFMENHVKSLCISLKRELDKVGEGYRIR